MNFALPVIAIEDGSCQGLGLHKCWRCGQSVKLVTLVEGGNKRTPRDSSQIPSLGVILAVLGGKVVLLGFVRGSGRSTGGYLNSRVQQVQRAGRRCHHQPMM